MTIIRAFLQQQAASAARLAQSVEREVILPS